VTKDYEEDVVTYWITLRKEEERILASDGGNSISQYVEISLWKRL
jgi:hypothetical protein